MLKQLLRSSGIILAGLAFLILFYAAIVFAAWGIGNDEISATAEAEFSAETQRQLELAQSDLDSDNLAMAVKRLQFLEENIPNNESVIALALSVTAQAVAVDSVPRQLPTPVVITSGGAATSTPTPLPPTETPNETPTPRPSPTRRATPHPEHIETQLSNIEDAIEDERWEDAIADLIAFQLESPSYERFYTDSLLFDAYLGGGFAFTNSNRVTIGINYFEQAEKLGELPEDALSQLYYSRVYLTAISYYGIDWPRSVSRLDEICTFAPGFQNACDLLFNARTAWGDQFAQSGDTCAAAEQYALALRVSSSSDVTQKLNRNEWSCDNATPTPWGSNG